MLISLQAYQRAVQSNPSQVTGWQGLVKLYEKILNDIKDDSSFENKNLKWNLDDVVNAYRKILSIYAQNVDIDKYVGISVKLVQLYQIKLRSLDSALDALSERIRFLETQTNEYTKVTEAYLEMVRLISSEAQANEVSDEKSMILCDTIEKVILKDA